jgi:hypothetical protein
MECALRWYTIRCWGLGSIRAILYGSVLYEQLGPPVDVAEIIRAVDQNIPKR